MDADPVDRGRDVRRPVGPIVLDLTDDVPVIIDALGRPFRLPVEDERLGRALGVRAVKTFEAGRRFHR